MKASELREGDIIRIPNSGGWLDHYDDLVGKEFKIYLIAPEMVPYITDDTEYGNPIYVDDLSFTVIFVSRPGVEALPPPEPEYEVFESKLRVGSRAWARAKAAQYIRVTHPDIEGLPPGGAPSYLDVMSQHCWNDEVFRSGWTLYPLIEEPIVVQPHTTAWALCKSLAGEVVQRRGNSDSRIEPSELPRLLCLGEVSELDWVVVPKK
jgi:hypothetical protein